MKFSLLFFTLIGSSVFISSSVAANPYQPYMPRPYQPYIPRPYQPYMPEPPRFDSSRFNPFNDYKYSPEYKQRQKMIYQLEKNNRILKDINKNTNRNSYLDLYGW
tara:strand:+ start:343 stop:657 length:315 start_codon:yes stop_codon:yes gene_type:complete